MPARYNAHTEPLFKTLNLLKINDIFTLSQLKFYHKFINNKLPKYFDSLTFYNNCQVHSHHTRFSNNFYINKVNHVFATKCIRYSITTFLNTTTVQIKEKL